MADLHCLALGASPCCLVCDVKREKCDVDESHENGLKGTPRSNQAVLDFGMCLGVLL